MDQESYAAAVHKTYESCIEELERNKARFVKNPEKDFTRERKISFSSCVHFCVEAGGGALQSELLRHFSFAQTTPTKSAFCQRCEKAILLLDRGFESYNTLAHLLLSGQKFVLRAKDIDSNGILST